MKTWLSGLLLAALLGGCTAHVHARYPTWTAYRDAHPGARFVFVQRRPGPHRTCWKVPRGWRCVVR